MADKPIKGKLKRPSKGQRANTRRLKQAARKEADLTAPQGQPRPVPSAKKQDASS